MKNTTFSHTLRILLCKNCGAPINVALDGGSATCTYCNVVSQWTRRAQAPVVRAPRMDEARRFDLLRQQDGQPLTPPPALAHLVIGGRLAPGRQIDALREWQQARQEIGQGASHGSAERMFFLTLLLYQEEGDEPVKQRALLETAIEVLTSERHHQVLRGMMARNAARVGDLAGAEGWLEACDPYSDDLHVDTAWRFSRAYVDTAKGDFAAVLRVLGRRMDDVPIADQSDLACAALRANAHEKLGDFPSAIGELERAMGGSPRAPIVLEEIVRQNAALHLCPASLPQARMRNRQRTETSRGGSGCVGTLVLATTIVPFALIGVGFWVAAMFASPDQYTDDGNMRLDHFFLMMGCIFGGIGIPALPLAAIFALRRRAFMKRAVEAVGTVVELSPTGMVVNDVPQMRAKLLVELPGRRPYEVSTSSTRLHGAQPGSSVHLRVDPKNPAKVEIL